MKILLTAALYRYSKVGMVRCAVPVAACPAVASQRRWKRSVRRRNERSISRSWASVFLLTAAMLAAAVSFSGCASTGQAPTPVAASKTPAQTRAADREGRLVVYSALAAGPEFYPATPYHRAYSDYRILSADGRLLRNVHNDSGGLFEAPATVKLPPGKYQIVARASGSGFVTMPVVITADQTTTVRLDAGLSPPGNTTDSGNAQTAKP
jgi:hypothetical protein